MTNTQASAVESTHNHQHVESGPYVLRKLDVDFALSEDGSEDDIYITCVDFWEGNLYVGTSAAEILHYFLLPPADDADTSQQFILATRLQPQYSENTPAAHRLGIQQILILPTVNKACVLCNGTLTFYTLPELSPIFTNTKLNNCLWVGGIDQGGLEDGEDNQDGIVIMICQKGRTRLIRIGEKLQRVREIEAGGYLDTIRRGSIACVADTKSYHLLDVVERQRIPLFEISSSSGEGSPPDAATPSITEGTKDPATTPTTTPPADAVASHERELSRDASLTSTPQRLLSPPPPASQAVDSQLPDRRDSLQPPPLEALRGHGRSSSQDVMKLRSRTTLLPHIASPSSSEFLLTTGTSFQDPGVGIFVNLDGDVVRGTLEFSRYPESLCIDSPEIGSSNGADITTEQDQFVIALVTGDQSKQLEIQMLDQDTETFNSGKFWLPIAIDKTKTEAHLGNTKNAFGIRPATSQIHSNNEMVASLLGLKRLEIGSKVERQGSSTEEDARREKQEAQFIDRLSSISSRVLVYGIDKVWWVSRNPAIVRLHARLQEATTKVATKTGSSTIDRRAIEEILTNTEGEEPTTELEFLTISSVKQQGSMLLFLDLFSQSLEKTQLSTRDLEATEKSLSEGEVDPRLLLLVMPVLQKEVVQAVDGIWVQGALKTLLDDFQAKQDPSNIHDITASGFDLLQLVRRYLFSWRRRKGFGSVTNEKEVFETVDAALLHVLLILDQNSRRGPGRRGSLRSELNTVVDHGVDCFDRAVELLEQFKRLYVLSRLYQSRKMSSKVLSTWKRILEGEEDTGGELTDGEQEMRRYLTVLNDAAVVEEYATWLAARNPKLGVRVFADGNKVRFEPKHVVGILKAHAPNAVKDYLEYLVFDKNLALHATDLINYYLDSVVNELSTSEEARETLLLSYTSYRALRPPKPTYSQFAADNTLSADWWHNRLRLLQLLGGSHGAASTYDLAGILSRIEPFSQELVPETIVLSGRQGKHREAISLLVHGLGDYDTAIRYCLLGGSGTYSPTSSSLPSDAQPSHGRQMALFSYLLEEFLRIEDIDQQITQTSELLERFAPWFEVEQVLGCVPDGWAVERLQTFLVCAIRVLVAERNETGIVKALVGVENLDLSGQVIEKGVSIGGVVQDEPRKSKNS